MSKGQTSPHTALAAMGFTATGLFAFGLACAALLIRPDVLAGSETHGVTRALTHMATLGWIGSLLFAGAYLIGPKLSGSALWNTRLPLVHFFCHLVGLVFLSGGLLLTHALSTAIGAWLIFIGLVMLVYNLLRTGSRRSLWTPSHMALQSALFWLTITGGVALFLLRLRSMEKPPIPLEVATTLHAHFALFGFLSQMLLGVSLRVAPELLGDHHHSKAGEKAAWAGLIGLNGGLLIFFSMALSGMHGAMFGAGIVIAFGVAAFAVAIVRALWATHVRLTWGVLSHITGVVLLVIITVGALVTFPSIGDGGADALRQWMRTYISLALLGPFAFAAFGAGQHLAPRLVWYLRYEPWKERTHVPPISALRRESAGGPVYFSLLMAWIYLLIGQIWQQPDSIRIAAALLLVGFIWFLTAISPALLRFIFGVVPEDLHDDATPSQNLKKP
ncbi:MAG TPA: hypothetical protein VNQ90_19540 [Chthoniobacteraceae bacterium]|nr:hypothetical protein [Chthoniobacteraceae bacterium]